MKPYDLENIVFDLGGVLVDVDLERCIAAFHRLGMPEVAELINPYYPAEMIGQFEKGAIDFREMCDRMRRLAGRADVTDEQISAAYGEFLAGIPVGRLRLVERLRHEGLRTYVLSNNNPESMKIVRRMFRADGHPMESYFDRIYLSYELHELKLSPTIFRKMVADSGMEPERTLFIDDGEKNVRAARELGFQVYMPSPGEDFGHLFDGMP